MFIADGGGGAAPAPNPSTSGSPAGGTAAEPGCNTVSSRYTGGPCRVVMPTSSGGWSWSNIWHGLVNGPLSIFTAPAAQVVSGVYQAGGGMAQAQAHLPGPNPAAGLAARVNQIGSHPVPGGNPASLSYKIPYYAAQLLLGAAGAAGKLRALLAAEEGVAAAHSDWRSGWREGGPDAGGGRYHRDAVGAGDCGPR